jgi:hypothetical protein
MIIGADYLMVHSKPNRFLVVSQGSALHDCASPSASVAGDPSLLNFFGVPLVLISAVSITKLDAVPSLDYMLNPDVSPAVPRSLGDTS